MTETQALETQQQIYSFILKNPGVHISRIAETLGFEVPLVIYHLNYLERHELITVDRQPGYSRCYIKGKVGVEDKRLLSILRRDVPLQIVLFLLKNPCSRHKIILEQFEIAKSTLTYHLKKLVEYRIIDIHIVDGEQEHGYVLVDAQLIMRFLMTYKPARISKGLKETWQDFTIYKKKD